MAFLLPYTRPITSSVWTFQKAWTRCLVAIPDFVRPPGPRSSWTRDERNAYARWRYATDAEYRQDKIERSVKYVKTRYNNDPDWRQTKLNQGVDKYANNPEFRLAIMQREREKYANNAEYREGQLQRHKERYANDPEWRQAKIQRERERYANDPEVRQAILQRARESYQRKKAELAADKDKSEPQLMSNPKDNSEGPATQP